LKNASTTKVIILLPSLAGGGAERTVLNLLKTYDRNKFTIKVLLISSEGSYSSSFNKADLIYSTSDFFRNNFFWQLCFFVFKIMPFHLNSLKSEKPDVVMTVTESMNYYGYFLKAIGVINGIWIIRSGNNIFAEARSKGFVFGNILQFLLKITYHRADHVIAISNGGKKSILNRFKISGKKITTIYNPIDLKKIESLASSVNHLELKKPFLLGIGRLAKQKRFDKMIRAFYESNAYKKGYLLVILGQGPQQKNLQKLVDDLSLNASVKFMGFQDNPYVYLRHAECFLLSSDWEGFAHVLAEALACDTEVITTNCDFGPAEILSDGRYGTILEGSDPVLFGKAIKQFLEDRGLNIHTDKNQRASDFDVIVIIPQYEELFTELASSSNGEKT
jgi:glycosyltransferase involved in cell wall biosynthesis|tara:strand:+ start:2250 stop:3419 length:1170 start_codon:yes stop_codon:yes gene_type:complete